MDWEGDRDGAGGGGLQRLLLTQNRLYLPFEPLSRAVEGPRPEKSRIPAVGLDPLSLYWTITFDAYYVNCIDGVYWIYNYTMLWCTTLQSYPAVWWHPGSIGRAGGGRGCGPATPLRMGGGGPATSLRMRFTGVHTRVFRKHAWGGGTTRLWPKRPPAGRKKSY